MSLSQSQMDEYGTLLKAFLDAADALCRGDKGAVQNLLNDDVVVNKIHDQVGTVRNKNDVYNYLSDKIDKEKPQLTPISTISVDPRTGTVSGLAKWEESGGKVSELIDYSFAFTLTKNGWRIRNMHASLH
jgi:hypothetical protein